MARIIDNQKEKLARVLNMEFAELDEIAIASAYFNIGGYGAIAEGLGDKPLKLLLGREPTETIKWEDEILKELEEYEDDSKYFMLLMRVIEYFRDERREVRIVEGRFFHGKAFVGVSPSLSEIRRGVGVVGSSNFTYGGLVYNRELNMLNTDREVVQELAQWFAEQWETARDFKGEFLGLLERYVSTWSPYEVVAKALYETYKGSLMEREEKLLKGLYPHQQLTLIDAKEKLEKYNGVVIADSTGLGKSRVGLALALEYVKLGVRPLLIAPKAVLDTTWESEMAEVLFRIDVLSTENLSHDPDVVEDYIGEKGPKLIIVDEAHYFRRASTIRYAALRRLVAENGAKVVLITATPVNTSLMDLYSLLNLYLPDDAIADMGRGSLRGYFVDQQRRWLGGEPINMDDVLRRFIVRHSRELVKALYRERAPSFPRRLFDERIKRYSIKTSLQKIDQLLESLHMAFYDLSIERLAEEFRLPDGTRLPMADRDRVENLKQLVKTIFHINAFKRLESSHEAFSETLQRLQKYIKRAAQYAEQYRVFVPPKLKGDLFRLIGDEDDGAGEPELPDPSQLFSNPKYRGLLDRCRLTDEEVRDFSQKCESDLTTIGSILELIPSDDEKYEVLEERLTEIMRKIENNNGVIVFTQYVDTASYLHERLRRAFGRVMLVTGAGGLDRNGKKVPEDEVVKDFQKWGGILVSTDVLAAGQNLQNAQYVVNYDFPWNPVILIQRIGRVDRIGSPYNEVYVVNVLPKNGDPDDPESLEHFLRLMQRLYIRLEAIRETVGLDASTLGEEAAVKDFSVYGRISRNDQSVLKELERRIEQFTRDPIDILARIINERGLDWVKAIPDGIGSVKDADFEGIFVLFTDGENFYWRLHRFDDNKVLTSPTEIVDILREGDDQKRGETIDYAKVVPLLKACKEALLKELKDLEVEIRTQALFGSKKAQKIAEALSAAGEEGERLAALFKKVSNMTWVVDELWKAMQEGELIETAREILPRALKNKEMRQDRVRRIVPNKLKRVCWCYIRKQPAGS